MVYQHCAYCYSFLCVSNCGCPCKDISLKERRILNLNEKFVFITGCDSGFGKQTALSLDALGFHVFAACLTSEGERHLQTLCSTRVKTLRVDVTKHEAIKQAYREILEALPSNSGRLDVYRRVNLSLV